MIYHRTRIGKFINRENRFIAYVEVDGVIERVHVPNTGRCAELFLPGVRVLLQGAEEGSKRVTKYSIVHVEKAGRWINIDSQSPNHLVAEYLEKHRKEYHLTNIRREVQYGKSRMDFAFDVDGRPALLEVKGVTLEKNGHAYFPDAPTSRGTKHVWELIEYARKGYPAYLFFVIQMKSVHTFSPNFSMDMDFSSALLEAREVGVKIIAKDTLIREEKMEIDDPVSLFFEKDLEGRPATFEDADAVYRIFRQAIASLKKDGVEQWQGKEGPNREGVLASIESGSSYVFIEEGAIIATAILQEEAEPTYQEIEGAWLTNIPYTTIHRFAVANHVKGRKVGKRALQCLIDLSYDKGFSSVRIDTHQDNRKMQKLITSMGFVYCGVVIVKDGTERLAYERILT